MNIAADIYFTGSPGKRLHRYNHQELPYSDLDQPESFTLSQSVVDTAQFESYLFPLPRPANPLCPFCSLLAAPSSTRFEEPPDPFLPSMHLTKNPMVIEERILIHRIPIITRFDFLNCLGPRILSEAQPV